MTVLQELALLLATDPVTGAAYARSILLMEAEAQATEVRIALVTWEYQRKLTQALKTHGHQHGVGR